MIALSTGSLYNYGLGRSFELAAEAGFEGVEVLVDHRWDTRHVTYLQRLQEEHRLPVVSLHTPFVRNVYRWERDPISRVKRTVALAEELKVEVVVAHLPLRWPQLHLDLPGLEIKMGVGPPEWGSSAYRRWLINDLTDFQVGIRVAIAVENMPVHRTRFGTVNPFALNDLETLADFPHLTLDTTHLGTCGIDVVAGYERLGERVAHVHLSNYNGRQQHRLMTDGYLRLEELLGRLAADGFGGAIVVELNPQSLGAGSEEGARARLQNTVGFVREHFVG